MKLMKYLLLCFITTYAVSQNITKIEDINGDGYIDTLESYYSGGSGFGGKYCTLIDGKSNEKFEIDTWGSFAQIQQTVLIPPALRREENQPFIEEIKKVILPKWRESPDPSLQWIINANNSNYRLSDNTFFNLIIFSATKWIEGNLKLPTTYYIDFKGGRYNRRYQKEDEGWLIYYGHNHYRNPTGDSLLVVESSNQYKILRTSHGLIANKEGNYKWIFVTDSQLTGSPSKLRWESIGDVILKDQYVLLSHELGLKGDDLERNYFLIDIESGKVGRLKVQSKKDYDSLIVNNWESIINEFYLLK